MLSFDESLIEPFTQSVRPAMKEFPSKIPRRFDNAVLLSHRDYATVEVLQERFERAMSNIVGKPLKLLNPELLSA